MSDVERYWNAIRAKWPNPTPEWKDLDPQRQMMIMQSINLLLQVLQ